MASHGHQRDFVGGARKSEHLDLGPRAQGPVPDVKRMRSILPKPMDWHLKTMAHSLMTAWSPHAPESEFPEGM